MEHFPWWTDEQKRIAKEVGEFAEEIIPRDAEARWKREFPWDIFERIAEKGYTGVAVPKEYGGMGLIRISSSSTRNSLANRSGISRTNCCIRIT